MSFLKQYLEQNAKMEPKKALREAKKLLDRTKGSEVFILTNDASNLLRQIVMPNENYTKLSKLLNDSLKSSFFTPQIVAEGMITKKYNVMRNKLIASANAINLPAAQVSLEPTMMYIFSELVASISSCSSKPMPGWTVRQFVSERRKYSGGTESSMFSKLEEIATSHKPKTPFLNSLITRALQPENCGSAEMTSRINWVVQSSAVDFLHLLLLSVEHLKKQYSLVSGSILFQK